MPHVRRLLWASAALLATTLGVAPSRAEDPKPAADDSPLRLFHVDALVAGTTDFIPMTTGLVGADSVNDEEHPLFGSQAEEPTLPIGGIDELIELLKSQVDPESWSSVSGVEMRPLQGRVLLVRQRPEALAALGDALRRYEERWLRTVTVEVQAVHLPPSDAEPTAQQLAALVAGEAAGPAVSLTARPGQRAVTFSGRQRSYVQDYDVEVAQKSKAADPFVGVTNVGLVVSVRAVPTAVGDRVALDLGGALTEWLAAPQVKVVDGGSIETPILAESRLQTTLEVPVGAWTRVDGAGVVGGQPAWTFLVRARVNAHVGGASGRGDALPVVASGGMGRMERRDFDLSALNRRSYGRIGLLVNLQPSNFTPPEPPELPEPLEACPPDAVVDLIRRAVAPDAWERGTLEARKDTLIAVAPDVALLAIERMLGALRRSLVWTVAIDGEVLDVPATLELASGSALSDEAAKALAAARADGSARTLERLRVSSFGGGRNNVVAGRVRTYVKDYEVEIAEDSAIGNPIVGRAMAGSVLDVEPLLDSTGTGASVTVRFVRSTLPESLPDFATPWGNVHLPEMRLWNVNTTVDAPFGKPTVVASALDAGRRTVLLITATLKRSGD